MRWVQRLVQRHQVWVGHPRILLLRLQLVLSIHVVSIAAMSISGAEPIRLRNSLLSVMGALLDVDKDEVPVHQPGCMSMPRFKQMPDRTCHWSAPSSSPVCALKMVRSISISASWTSSLAHSPFLWQSGLSEQRPADRAEEGGAAISDSLVVQAQNARGIAGLHTIVKTARAQAQRARPIDSGFS